MKALAIVGFVLAISVAAVLWLPAAEEIEPISEPDSQRDAGSHPSVVVQPDEGDELWYTPSRALVSKYGMVPAEE